MRYHIREKDYRRIGYVFQDDPFEEKPISSNMTAVQNWKSVMTELNEKNSKHREPSDAVAAAVAIPKTLDSSFDSGIQQEYSSDNDEVCNSICMTLNRLVELSKEQQLYLSQPEHLDNSARMNAADFAEMNGTSKCSENLFITSMDRLSIQSANSETNNLVEEMIMKNACTNECAVENLHNTVLGRYAQGESSTVINHNRYLSRSAQNLSVGEAGGDNSFQSLPVKRGTYIKNNSRSKLGYHTLKHNSEIVITIDIGTTFSGFAYSIDGVTSGNVHTMKSIKGIHRKDPHMKKLPTILLLNSRTEFHSFGYDAKDYYLSIEQKAAPLSLQWLLFEKFKLQLLSITEIDRECEIKATNGVSIPALTVYTRTLNYFKCLALLELSNVLQKPVKKHQIRWVISIPVMWSIKGKLFIQEAAFNAGLCTLESKNKLTVTYEPEAAAAWCNIFSWGKFSNGSHSPETIDYVMVVNCGGGSVDVTVHRANDKNIYSITEVHKPSETIYSSHSINEEFMQLLILIFGNKFMNLLKTEKPASLIDILYQFESCKCFLSKLSSSGSSAKIFVNHYITDFYKKITGKQFNETVINFGHEDVNWTDEGAILINTNLMQRLFQPVTQRIIKFIKQILQNRNEGKNISRVYFIGGLTKSYIFQEALKTNLEHDVSLIFTQNEAELCVLKGAVQKGYTDAFKYCKMSHSFAVGVLKQFQDDLHPPEKMVLKDGRKWCCDLLDWLIKKDEILQEGEVILKRYTPTTSYQSYIIINIYAVEHEDSKFVTDDGVHNCGALRLSCSASNKTTQHEILLQLIYTGKEFIANALDTVTGYCTQTQLDNLSYL